MADSAESRISSFDPLPPRAAKIGVKVDEADRREPVPPRDCLFMTYVDELRQARQDYQGSIRFSEELIARYETGNPDAVQIEVARCYGAGTTIAEAIEKEWTTIAEVWAMLEEVEDASDDHEEDLLYVLNTTPSDDQENYPLALTRFVQRYGDEPTHLEWLILRATTEAQMGYDVRGQGNWGEDMRWRKGEVTTPIAVDPSNLVVDYTTIDGRDKIAGRLRMTEASLYAASKVAAIIAFHEREGNEGPRAYWQHWLDRELSTLSRIGGVDFKLDIEANKLPNPKTIQRWESEINVLDSEEQAKLRHWEAVCHFWYCDEGSDADADTKWAEYVEGEAEESRLWALGKRERVIRERAQLGRRCHPSSIALRRIGTRARQSRGRPARHHGSRRVPSRSAGGGSSEDDPGGDPEPGERPGQRLVGLVVVCAMLALGLAVVGSSSAHGGDLGVKYETSGEDFLYPSMRPFRPAPESRFRQLQPGSRSAAEALFNDPRRFAHDKDRAVSDYHDWWSEVAFHILERSADAYDPHDSYLADNLGPEIAETLGDKEMVALLRALLDGDASMATSCIGRVTRHSERSALKHRRDSYEHYEIRRMANGELRILMDQRHASRLRSRSPRGPISVLLASPRTSGRSRASRGSAVRSRGSRRVTSRSAGGGSSGDSSDPPDGHSEPGERPRHVDLVRRRARPVPSAAQEGGRKSMSSIATETRLLAAAEVAIRFKKGGEPLGGEHQLQSYVEVRALAGAGQ